MDRPKVLLVFYSRSGHARAIAQALGDCVSCDVEEIADQTDRRGWRGYLRSGFEAAFHRRARLSPIRVDPADYDLVIVGGPVWNASVSAPVRTFLELHSGKLRRVAFFVSYGGMGSRRVFRQMGRLAGTRALAMLAVREKTIDHGQLKDKVDPFVEEIRMELKAEAMALHPVDVRISAGQPVEAEAPHHGHTSGLHSASRVRT
jgi:flavodoxin